MSCKFTTDVLDEKTDAPSKPKASTTTSASVAAPVLIKAFKLSVSALIALNKDKEKSKSSFSTAPKKLKSKPPPKDSHTVVIDLPPSDSDDNPDLNQIQKSTKSAVAQLDTATLSMKEIKKREMKDRQAALAAELARKEALRNNRVAFTVVIDSRTAALDADKEAAATTDANGRDITIENFSFSTRRKELLKNDSFKISHRKRYGLVSLSGMGKSKLLKLLAWRKILVPCNIDVLLVE